ncbi:zinc finger, CCHC-type containing protein [Tanacetum coccineum]
MGDANPIRTLGDYSKPSHEGYRNTIELPVGNNVVPLRSDTIRLVQNGCSFHELWSEDPNQHLKDFLKLVDSLDLDGENRERTRLRLFQFSLRDQASNWLERLPAGSITTWEDLTTRFLAQFFPSGRTAKLRNNILIFQQHLKESLSEAWTRFKDLLQKFPHHGIDLWLQVQIFYDRIDHTLKRTVKYTVGDRLRKMSAEKAWATIEELARYEDEGWNDLVAPEEGSLDYENSDIEQLLGGHGMNGYLRKGRKTKPKRQNRTRNGKAWKRQSQDKAQLGSFRAYLGSFYPVLSKDQASSEGGPLATTPSAIHPAHQRLISISLGLSHRIPYLEGPLCPDDFLDWLRTVDRIFDLRDTPDHIKVNIGFESWTREGAHGKKVLAVTHKQDFLSGSYHNLKQQTLRLALKVEKQLLAKQKTTTRHLKRDCPNKQVLTLIDEVDPLYDTEDEAETEVVYPDRGELLVTRRLLNTAVLDQDDDTTWLRTNIFRTQCTAKGKVCTVIIDGGRNGDSRGFAFVRYKYSDEAQKAVDRLDGREVVGREITVQFAKYGPNAERIDRGRIIEKSHSPRGRSRSRTYMSYEFDKKAQRAHMFLVDGHICPMNLTRKRNVHICFMIIVVL